MKICPGEKFFLKGVDKSKPLCYTVYAIKKGVELMKHFGEEVFLDIIRTFVNSIGEKRFKEWDSYKNKKLKCGFCTAGLFRCVFIPKEHNFVIKLARNGNKAGERQLRKELEVYQHAQEKNLHNWFAMPLAFGNSPWGFWVAFEYVGHIGEANDFIPEEESVTAKITAEELYSLYYTEELVYAMRSVHYARLLEKFCKENDINDLHDNNYGWDSRKNHAVITDYGGC